MDCKSCKFDEKDTRICKQGHYRLSKGIGSSEIIPIPDCHGWAEKEKCECEERWKSEFLLGDFIKLICKKCGRIIE